MIDHLIGRDPERNKHFWSYGQCAPERQERFARHQSKLFCFASDVAITFTQMPTSIALWIVMQRLYMEGLQCHHGTKPRATLLDRWPVFGKMGWRRCPREHRALKMWPILTRLEVARLAQLDCCGTELVATALSPDGCYLVLLRTLYASSLGLATLLCLHTSLQKGFLLLFILASSTGAMHIMVVGRKVLITGDTCCRRLDFDIAN